MVNLIHKGKKLVPLTRTEATSLDRGDVVKYIGPAKGQVYSAIHRRPIRLSHKPKLTTHPSGRMSISIDLTYYGAPSIGINKWALVERGDPHAPATNRAKRFLRINLKGFRRDVERLLERTKNRIDNSMEELPLHKRLEIFATLEGDYKILYDFLYKDLDETLGLKEPSEEDTEDTLRKALES